MRCRHARGTHSDASRYCRRMPHYITLMRWTTQGYVGLPKWRERVEEGERVIREAGGHLVGVYVAIEILMKLNRYGAEQTETLRAFTREEAEDIIRRL